MFKDCLFDQWMPAPSPQPQAATTESTTMSVAPDQLEASPVDNFNGKTLHSEINGLFDQSQKQDGEILN
jgi:hypothetical protein